MTRVRRDVLGNPGRVAEIAKATGLSVRTVRSIAYRENKNPSFRFSEPLRLYYEREQKKRRKRQEK